MPLPHRRRFTPAEYLLIERHADCKSEYLAGDIYAMGGASEAHNLIVLNAAAELRRQLKGRACKVYASDMRVKAGDPALYAYPDVVALCGPARFDDALKDTLVNPTLIIEVLSPSTASYDRGEKFGRYRQIDSLTEYLLIAQDRPLVEHYVRQANSQWLLAEHRGLQETVRLPSIDGELALAEIYDKVELDSRTWGSML
ncbi:MAG: Uma2 family endonuclease [Pseudomonadota bacterium]|nr:Uma2 family endonuclease [Pseudomonadota bacterium]